MLECLANAFTDTIQALTNLRLDSYYFKRKLNVSCLYFFGRLQVWQDFIFKNLELVIQMLPNNRPGSLPF